MRIATRPIHLDRREAEASVGKLQRFLQEGYWGRNPEQPLGSSLAFTDKVMVKAVDGSEFEVQVQYRSKESGSWDMVLGGGSGKTTVTKKPAIIVFVNGNYSGSAFTTTTSGERFNDNVMEVLEHELTHQADVFAQKFDPSAKRHTLPSEGEIDEDTYYNNPSEVRAYMRSVFENVMASLPKIYPHFTVSEIMKRLAFWSPIWKDINGKLSNSNRKLILKGVTQAVQDWFDEQSRQRVASMNEARELLRMAKELLAVKQVLDTDQIQKFRKEYLMLMSNAKRIDSYSMAKQWSGYVKKWRNDFEEYLYKYLIKDLENLKWRKTITEDMWKYWDKKIREETWSFVIDFSVPISDADGYYSEERRFANFQSDLPKWKRRIEQKARAAWAVLADFVQWYDNATQSKLVVEVPVPVQTEMEGFAVTLVGDDSVKDAPLYVERFKRGLKLYKQRAAKVYPWLLHNQLPLVLDFKGDIGTGGEYKFRYIWINGYLSGTPDNIVHTLAHEMGHHRYDTIGYAAQDFWRKMLSGDLGDVDLRDVVKTYSDGEWVFDNKKMKMQDPLLYNQMMALTQYSGAGSQLKSMDKIVDIKNYLEKGGEPIIKVHAHQISGYANKNDAEAFCEALGLLVAYGPNSLSDVVLDWLRTILPDSRTASMV